MAEGVGDMLGLDGVPALVERIEVLVERSVGRSVGALEALGDPAESFDGTEERCESLVGGPPVPRGQHSFGQ